MTPEARRIVAAVRAACLAAAREAYEDAGIRGLCAEGRWEAALGAIAAVDEEAVRNHQDEQMTSDEDESDPPAR